MEASPAVVNWLNQGKALIDELEIDIRVAENDLAEKKNVLKHLRKVFPNSKNGGGTRAAYPKCPDCGAARNSRLHRETCSDLKNSD